MHACDGQAGCQSLLMIQALGLAWKSWTGASPGGRVLGLCTQWLWPWWHLLSICRLQQPALHRGYQGGGPVQDSGCTCAHCTGLSEVHCTASLRPCASLGLGIHLQGQHCRQHSGCGPPHSAVAGGWFGAGRRSAAVGSDTDAAYGLQRFDQLPSQKPAWFPQAGARTGLYRTFFSTEVRWGGRGWSAREGVGHVTQRRARNT